MKIIKITFILFLILQINKIYSQGISEEYKQEVINSLAITTVDSIDTPHYGGNAIEAVIDYKIEEAIPEIIANIWKQDPYDQTRFIDALYFLGAEETEEIALAFLDSVDTYENTNFTKLELKLLAVQNLFYLGNYSKYQIVFDRIEESKPGLEYGAIFMLPYIIWNYPEHEERAKQELLKFAYESEEDIYKWYAVVNLDTVYGEKMLNVYFDVFENSDSSNKNIIIPTILSKYKNDSVLNFLINKLSLETNQYVRYHIGERLLLNYGSPAIFKFVKDFQITDTTNLFLSMAVGTFRPIKPANSKVSTSTMLDTLTSYTTQCYNYNWLEDEAYKNELLTKLTNAKNYLTVADSVNSAIEIQTFQNSVSQVYSDSAGSYPKYISREGYKFLYYYAQYILDRLPAPFTLNEITAKVRAKVIKKKNGKLKYKYKLKNKPESNQDIALFYVKEKTDTVKLNSPDGWIAGELAENNLISFSADSEGVEIQPGDLQKGFSVKGKRLPHIENYYIQSSRVLVDTTDIYGNSFSGLTLSPALAPSPFIALEFIDTLINYNDQAYNLGWVKNENVYNNFSRKLNKAKTKLENGKERKAKEILREFVQLVRKKWCNRKITSEALGLLKFNAQYLIKHVGPPDLENNLAGVTLVSVERLDGENRRYKYEVHNSVNNPDKLSAFYVKESVNEFTAKAPEDWTQTAIDSLNLVCYNTDVTSAMIKPEKKKKGYRIKVESLPVIMPFYILVKDQPSEADTILYNSITGFTLGPESLPEEFVGLDQVDNLYEHVEEANDLGWIKQESVYDNLIDRVNTIRNKVEKDKTEQAKTKLQDFVDYVQDKFDQDKITKEARILLKQNANYVKRNL